MTAREELNNFLSETFKYYPHDEMSINELIDEVIAEALQARLNAFKDNQSRPTLSTATSAQIMAENEQKETARSKFIFQMVSYIQQVDPSWLRVELIKALGDIHAVVEEARPKWISVEDRLPVGTNNLLFCLRDKGETVIRGPYYGVYYDFSTSWYYYLGEVSIEVRYHEEDVVCWQPLPQAPKGGEAL